MAKQKKSAIKRKRSLAAKKGWETRRKKARSLAAKKGWETKRKKARSLAAKKGWRKHRKKLVGIENLRSPVVFTQGPHKREALSKDWDGFDDIGVLAETVKEAFPYAEAWHWSLKFRFVSDPDTGEGEDRWVSRSFDSDFDRAVGNIRDYLEVFTSGKMNYGMVIPLAVTVTVFEGI